MPVTATPVGGEVRKRVLGCVVGVVAVVAGSVGSAPPASASQSYGNEYIKVVPGGMQGSIRVYGNTGSANGDFALQCSISYRRGGSTYHHHLGNRYHANERFSYNVYNLTPGHYYYGYLSCVVDGFDGHSVSTYGQARDVR